MSIKIEDQFMGEMMEFKRETISKLGYIETKLDNSLENNRKESAIISGITGIAIAIAGLLTGKHS